MFNLPESTEVNRVLPIENFLKFSTNPSMIKKAFDEKILSVIWKNRISTDNYNCTSGKKYEEIQFIEINLSEGTIDKNTLSLIDATIPYYTVFKISEPKRYQYWSGTKLKTKNNRAFSYIHTDWIENDDVALISGKSVDEIFKDCIGQLARIKYAVSGAVLEQYIKNMKMQYAYKALTILAVLENDGIATVNSIVNYCKDFYLERIKKGLQPDKEGCGFIKSLNSYQQMENIIINNPIRVLLESGLFEYKAENKTFYIIKESYYKGKINEIQSICKEKLKNYYYRNLCLIYEDYLGTKKDFVYEIIDLKSIICKIKSQEVKDFLTNDCEFIRKVISQKITNNYIINLFEIKITTDSLKYEEIKNILLNIYEFFPENTIFSFNYKNQIYKFCIIDLLNYPNKKKVFCSYWGDSKWLDVCDYRFFRDFLSCIYEHNDYKSLLLGLNEIIKVHRNSKNNLFDWEDSCKENFLIKEIKTKYL